MSRFHNISGVRVQFTAVEETAWDAEEIQSAIDKEAAQAAEAARVAAFATGRQKLVDLGLSESEVDALIGTT